MTQTGHASARSAHVRPLVSGDMIARRLSSLAPLSPRETAFLSALPSSPAVRVGQELAREGVAPPSARFVVTGWGCRLRLLPDGRRQILGLLLPGDAIGVCRRPRALALSAAAALTPMTMLDGSGLMDALKADEPWAQGLDLAMEVSAALDEAFLLDQIIRLGRLTAYERVCHLLLEMHHRLERVGLARDWRFAMPLTQDALADITGLSVVHVNRTLQQLRRENLLSLSSGVVVLLEPELMRTHCDFRSPRPIH